MTVGDHLSKCSNLIKEEIRKLGGTIENRPQTPPASTAPPSTVSNGTPFETPPSSTSMNSSVFSRETLPLPETTNMPRRRSHDDPPVCLKCHESYPSKEALKLHNCQSLIATMAADGEVRDSRVRGRGRQSLAESPGPSHQSSTIASPH